MVKITIGTDFQISDSVFIAAISAVGQAVRQNNGELMRARHAPYAVAQLRQADQRRPDRGNQEASR
jgi:hypothetical protein